MKTLLENWNKFLKESEEEYNYDAEVAKEREELEQKHFGASANIGKIIYDIYQKKLQSLKSKGYSSMQILDEHNDIFFLVKHNYNKMASSNKIVATELENSGRGAFRAVFSCDKDYVIKIDASVDGSGVDMNREDQQLGINKKYGDIFPRVFMHDPEYKWIVAEKVKQIDDYEGINMFFPNPLLRSYYMNTHMYLYTVRLVMEYKVEQMKGNKTMVQFFNDKFVDVKQSTLVYNSRVTIEKVIENFNKNPNFFKIVSAIFEFGIEPEDAIRPGNMGIGYDGRLVILDPSIAATLEKGRENFNQKNP
jgi:hypothetical protein